LDHAVAANRQRRVYLSGLTLTHVEAILSVTEQRAAGPKQSKKRAAELSAHRRFPDQVAADAEPDDESAADAEQSADIEQSAAERRKSKKRKPRLSPPLPSYLRYPDLVAANIVTSWMGVSRLIDTEGFPPGVLLSANTRAWRRDEVEAWLASRPSGKKPIPGRAA
jgi:predicted DNA-binding transcriptional regulator AlpA